MKYTVKVPPSSTEQTVEITIPDLPPSITPVITGTTPIHVTPTPTPEPVPTGYTETFRVNFDVDSDLKYDGNGQYGNGIISKIVYKNAPGSFYSRPANVSNGTRSEVQYTRDIHNPVEGAIEYDVMYEVIVPNNGCSLQWHPHTPGSSGSPYLMHEGGNFTWVVWLKGGGVNYYKTGIPITKGVWQKFRVEFKFGTPTQGAYLRWFIDGKKVFEKLNIQLGDGSGQYLKLGYNGWDPNSANSRIYYDNLRIFKKS